MFLRTYSLLVIKVATNYITQLDFLLKASDSDAYLNVFYIWQIACPTGFVKIDKRCQCDPVLVQYGITNCNIVDTYI